MKGEKTERVGVAELKTILPGETKIFLLPTGAKRYSAQAQAYKMPLANPRKHIVKYTCRSLPPTDDGLFPLAITAVKV